MTSTTVKNLHKNKPCETFQFVLASYYLHKRDDSTCTGCDFHLLLDLLFQIKFSVSLVVSMSERVGEVQRYRLTMKLATICKSTQFLPPPPKKVNDSMFHWITFDTQE